MRRADNVTTFMCPLSWNLEASTSWNPQGLSRPVMGLLYLRGGTHSNLRCFIPKCFYNLMGEGQSNTTIVNGTKWCIMWKQGYMFRFFSVLFQGRNELFGAPRQWKHFRPLFQAVFLSGGGISPQTESNITPPSPKTEITNILFYILNFASIIKFKM